MNRKHILSVSLAVLVLLSGCSGVLPGGETETPTTTNSTPEDGETLPPGVTSSGVQDWNALLQSHSTTLQSTSFSMEMSSEVTQQNETSSQSTSASYQADPQKAVQHQSSNGIEIDSYLDTTVNQNESFTRYASENETIYKKSPASSLSQLTRARTIGQLATLYNFEVQGSGDTHQLVSTGVKNQTQLNQAIGAEVSSSELRLTVTDDGVIKEMQYDVETSSGATLALDLTFSDIGSTTVSEPAWFSEAQNNYIDAQLSVSDNGEYLVLDYNQGVTIDEGSRVFLMSSTLRQGTTNTTLEPGNTYYVQPNEGNIQITSEPPEETGNTLQDPRYQFAVYSPAQIPYFQLTVTNEQTSGGDSGNTTTTESGN